MLSTFLRKGGRKSGGAFQFSSGRRRGQGQNDGRNRTCLCAPVCSRRRPPGAASRPVVAAELTLKLAQAPEAFVAAEDQNLGPLEVEVRRQTRERRPRAVEAGARANPEIQTPPASARPLVVTPGQAGGLASEQPGRLFVSSRRIPRGTQAPPCGDAQPAGFTECAQSQGTCSRKNCRSRAGST